MVEIAARDTPASRHRSRVGSGLYAHVFQALGQEIIDGTLPIGSIVFAEQISERFGVFAELGFLNRRTYDRLDDDGNARVRLKWTQAVLDVGATVLF